MCWLRPSRSPPLPLSADFLDLDVERILEPLRGNVAMSFGSQAAAD